MICVCQSKLQWFLDSASDNLFAHTQKLCTLLLLPLLLLSYALLTPILETRKTQMMMGFHTPSQLHPECSIEKSRWSFCRILPKSGEQDQQKSHQIEFERKKSPDFFRAFTLRIFITKEKRQSGKKGFHFVSSASTNTLWLYVFNLPQVQVTIKSCYPREILIYALCPIFKV